MKGLVTIRPVKRTLFLSLCLFLTIVLSEFGCGTNSSTNSQSSPSYRNELAITPPMGWNSWNKFQCVVSDKLIREIADAMVTNGMKDAGYQYVNIDDCWELPNREDGHLKADPSAFPEGIKGLADFIHSKGLKLGLYSDRGNATCQGKAGSYGYETVDAKDFADWGVDYLKYDNCNPPFFSNQARDYKKMRDALTAAGRPIVFSICAWGFLNWMPETGNLWRTGGDIHDDWGSMIGAFDNNEQVASYARPGAWNDPDMLEIGNGGMTDTEYRTHFSLWAIMAAPLIAGNDLRTMSPQTADILLNREVIAVDQDPWGLQGVRVADDGQGSNVYSKVLEGPNSRAVALLNRSTGTSSITAKWSDLGLPPGPASVRDLWNHQDLGIFNDSYTVSVPPHGTVLLKVLSQVR